MHVPISTILLGLAVLAEGRRWNNTRKGTIVLEEAWTVQELIGQIFSNAPPVGQTIEQLRANLLDVHNQRLSLMDAHGIDYMVLSCANPCIQGIVDPVAAETMARNVNDQLAGLISNNSMRFGGFASLSMHNATVAALELKRTVTEYGFLGALINDFQQAGPEETLLFYDGPAYDEFWQTVSDLNVPVYLHPRTNVPPFSNIFQHAPWIRGAAHEFAVTLSNHVLGLCTNGVFDRFPKVQIVIGHLGERISSDLFRIDEQLKRQLLAGMPMLRNVTYYYQNNIFETTSGNFDAQLLEFHMSKIGIERILYSIDYPYVSIEEGQDWVAGLELRRRDMDALLRGNAIKLLRLDDK